LPDFGFKSTKITVQRSGANLNAVVFDHYAPGEGRTDRTTTYTLSGGGVSAPPDPGGPVLWFEVGALNPTPAGTRQARLGITTKPDFDRLYQALTDKNLQSRLEIRCFATAGRRTWRQVFIRDPDSRTELLLTDFVHTAASPQVAAAANTRKIILSQDAVKLQPNFSAAELNRNPAPLRMQMQMVRPAFALAQPALAFNRAALSTASATKVNPGIGEALRAERITERVDEPVRHVEVNPAARQETSQFATLVSRSDIFLQAKQGAAVPAVPVRAVVDQSGQPALMQIAVETGQQISPFWFLVDTNAYMFDIPGDMRPTANHVLIPMQVRDSNGKTGMFYQDSGFADQFYFQPELFLVPRLDTPPYLPDLRVVFFDLITADGDPAAGDGTLHYKVQIAYRVVPYIDPVLLELAQQQAPAVKARFQALAPEHSALKLSVPEDETNGALTDVPRPAAEVRFDQGIVDQMELTRTEFERVFSFFQSPAGIGIEGSVDATLPGSLNAHVPVRLSLKQNPGNPFNTSYLGPQENGLHRVQIKQNFFDKKPAPPPPADDKTKDFLSSDQQIYYMKTDMSYESMHFGYTETIQNIVEWPVNPQGTLQTSRRSD